MLQFLLGSVSVTALLGAIFFLRFWRQTKDRLFLLFSVGFLLLSLHWVLLAASNPSDEFKPYIYSFRMLAFVIIAAAVLDKNRNRHAPGTPPAGNALTGRERPGA